MIRDIHPLGVGQNSVAADVFGEAFASTPQWEWMIPNDKARETILPTFFKAFIDHAVSVGRVHVAGSSRFGFSGAAVWLPSDHVKVPSWRMAVAFPTIAKNLSMSELREFGKRGSEFESAAQNAHPRAPHRYLAGIAVAPSKQSVGVGRGLLEHGLQLIDARHEDAYLECAESLVPYYEQFGFVELNRIVCKGGAPEQIGMWRQRR